MNRFEIIKKLGDGSFSVVYKVRRKLDNNIYALKKVKLLKLKEKEKQNALNEVRILASLKSPFVIKYKEAFIEESDKSLCIVMEYANNGDLHQTITKFRKMNYLMDESDIWRILIQMVKGLKSLHDLNILHRDLKSANIFLFSDGTAKIGDCNVSKILYKGLGYTQTGTPYYASPEVWNDTPYDNKSDIWSLGVVLYEMITLYPPFRAENMEALYKKVLKGQYAKINSKYSDDISNIIKLLLKVNPNERPTCDQILKNKSVMERIDFFKDREGFIDDDFENMDEMKLLKTLRVTQNLLFLSEQLPEPNYENKKSQRINPKKNNNRSNKINNNSSLPNISNVSHSHIISEEKKDLDYNNSIKLNNNKSSKKLMLGYKITNNTNNLINKNYSIYNNETQKNLLIKTDNTLTPINKSSHFLMNKDLDRNNHYELINNIPTYRQSQEKQDKNNLKYTQGLSEGNLYSIINKETKKNNKINNYYKSQKKNIRFLPNIYKYKSNNPGNRYELNERKYD